MAFFLYLIDSGHPLGSTTWIRRVLRSCFAFGVEGMLFLTEQGSNWPLCHSFIKILSHTNLCIRRLCPFFLSTMQRSMSYRKPVPTYIPSPPSSPCQSTFPPSTQPNLDLEVPPVRIFSLFSPSGTLLSFISCHPIGVRFWTKLACSLRGPMLNHVNYYQQSLGNTSKWT